MSKRNNAPDGPIWIIYDERGHFDPDDAAVLETCSSLREVYEAKEMFNAESAVYSYTIKAGVAEDEVYLGRLGDVRRRR